MSTPTKTRAWVLQNHPKGMATYDSSDSSATFTIKELDLPALRPNQILVQTLYLSNDPAQRGWISSPEQLSPDRLYVPPVQIGAPMRARGLAKVLKTRSDDFAEGDLVMGQTCWQEYAVIDLEKQGKTTIKIQQIPGVSPTHSLGGLGLTGATAYYGLVEVAGLKQGETVVVSGAAGATGSMVVQIAKKMVGAKKVIGIAGTDEKCRWAESLGADICLNYKSDSFKQDLKTETGSKADVYFDNVAGAILDEMLGNMARHGRIAACGAITDYNEKEEQLMKNYFQIISMRIRLQGFIVSDADVKGITELLVQAVKEGKIKLDDSSETVVESSFDEIPKTWLKLFDGSNQGKLVTKL